MIDTDSTLDAIIKLALPGHKVSAVMIPSNAKLPYVMFIQTGIETDVKVQSIYYDVYIHGETFDDVKNDTIKIKDEIKRSNICFQFVDESAFYDDGLSSHGRSISILIGVT